jgi:hypothetical protein
MGAWGSHCPLNILWDAAELKARYDYRTEYAPEGRAGLHVPLTSSNFDDRATGKYTG